MKTSRIFFRVSSLLVAAALTQAPVGVVGAQSCVTPPAGLTAWWPGEGNGSDLIGSHPLTPVGGATFGAGLDGQAFHLDGVDDHFETSDPIFNVGTGDFTVDFWVRFAGTSGEQVLVEKWVDGVSGWTITKLGSNQIQFAAIGSSYPTSSPQSIATNTWMHVAVRRSSGTIALFLNGTSILTGSTSANLDSTSPLMLGRRSDGRGFFLDGDLDEVHFLVGTALSDSDIQAIYNAGSSGVCTTPVCGNGIRQGPEECDDGNMTPGDGCENDCTLSCGDNAVTGSETCDDGNRTDGDGCDSNCTPTGCGNGIATSGTGETCDDGNISDDDDCLTDCTANVCGDGHRNIGVEECDDGNLIDGDGCDADCTVGHICIVPLANLVSWWPGDQSTGDLAGGRNAVLRNEAHYAAGKAGDAFALDGVDDFVSVPSHPSLNVGTGDFTVDLWVQFEDTNDEQVLIEKYVEKFNPSASSGWTLTKLRGNTLRFVTKTQSVDSSRLTLQPHVWTHFAARRSGLNLAIFLNGTKVGAATVDAAPDLSSSAALKFGHRGGPSDTPGSTDTRGFLLHGQVDEVHLWGRALDDAEIAAVYNTDDAGLCVPTPFCSNGLAEAGEACDDGNAVADDGCENDCTLSCGNGVSVAPEACDDGNAVEGDGCDSNCTASACGNEIIAPNEECDDGNLEDGDDCDANCTATACGNGVRTTSTGEDCDDGNDVDGDGCESDCTITPVTEVAPPGGTVTTDPNNDGASPQAPTQVALTTPDGGTVSIATSTEPLTPEGVYELVRQLLIEAPPATAAAPLVITLTVDASAIPPGVDLLRVDIIRDGVLLEPCSGTPGTASPDPCIQSRVLLMDGDVEITALTSHASLWGVVVRGLGKDEQKCVNGMNKAGTKVAKAQGALNASCLKAANSGDVLDPQACVSADAAGKVSKARQKATDFAGEACAPAPPFGFLSDSATNAATQQAKVSLLADVFGVNLGAAITSDKDTAKCQSAVSKGLEKVFAVKAKLLFDCVAAGLSGKLPPVMVAAPNLARCLAAVDADVESKAAKTVGKLAGALLGKCDGVPLATALPGACGTSDDVSYCLETKVDCRLCDMFAAMAGVTTDCDAFDDGTLNASCD